MREFTLAYMASRWGQDYELSDVVEHPYGLSPIFLNKKTKNRFSPAMLPHKLVHEAVVKNSAKARAVIEKELEAAFVKERISG